MKTPLLVLAATLLSPLAHASTLEDAALALQPGNWVELTTENLVPTFTNSGGNSGIILGYAEEFKWDSMTGRLIYIGMDHNQPEGERFVVYTESDNTWSLLPTEPWMEFSGTRSHAYDHHAIDVVRRTFYFRYPYAGRSVYRYDLDGGGWTQLPNNDLLDYDQCCGALEYVPELDGVVWVQAGEFSIPNGNAGGVFLYTETADSWSRLGEPATYQMGTYQNFAEYLPTHGVLVFGGGNDVGSRMLYKLDGSGQVTQLADAPIDVGVHQTVQAADPVSGELLVLTSDERFFAYQVDGDTWGELPAPNPAVWTPSYQNSIHGVVAAPIDTYGVIAYVSCEPGTCHFLLYRHKEGTGMPPTTGAGGNGGSSGTPTTASGAGGGSTSNGAGGASALPNEEAGGCGCHVAPRTRATGAFFALLLLIAARRRRNREAR